MKFKIKKKILNILSIYEKAEKFEIRFILGFKNEELKLSDQYKSWWIEIFLFCHLKAQVKKSLIMQKWWLRPKSA